MNKGLQLRSGQVHAQRYIARLLEHVECGHVDPSFVATHEMSLAEAQNAYQAFKQKSDSCVRVVFRPHAAAAGELRLEAGGVRGDVG
jgi:threonine dehydrogenase-like Zn-dependent dehydrogenase